MSPQSGECRPQFCPDYAEQQVVFFKHFGIDDSELVHSPSIFLASSVKPADPHLVLRPQLNVVVLPTTPSALFLPNLASGATVLDK